MSTRRTLIAVGAAALVMAPTAAHAAEEEPLPTVEDVIVIDESDILDEDTLTEAITELEHGFDEEFLVAVVATDEVDGTEEEYDESVTSRIIEIGEDPLIVDGELNPDAFVITISPEDRRLGAYSGDGIETPDSSAVVSQMTSAAQDAEWDNAAYRGVQQYLNDTKPASQGQALEFYEEGFTQGVIYVGIGIGTLILIGGLIAGISGLASMRREKKYRDTYDNSRHHVQGALKMLRELKKLPLDDVIRYTDIKPLPSPDKVDAAISDLEQVEQDNFNVPKHVAEDRMIRRITDDYQRYQPSIDAIRSLQSLRGEGRRIWEDQLKPQITAFHDEVVDLNEEIAYDENFKSSEQQRIDKRATKSTKAIDGLIKGVENGTVDPLTAVKDAEQARDGLNSLTKKMVRDMPKSRQRNFDTPYYRDHNNVFGSLLLTAAIISTTSGGSSSSDSYSSGSSNFSVPTTTFSGGGFSGGSGGF